MPDIIIAIAEDLSSYESDPEASTIYIERLLELSETPVQINSGDESEISRIFFLTEFQVQVLCDYIKSNGIITTPYEIAYLPGFDNTTAMMIKPFAEFGAVNPANQGKAWINQSISTNVTYRTGADTSKPDLSSLKILTKYKLSAGRMTMGLTSEKDAGEKSIFETHKAPDFLSGFVAYQGKGLIRNIIIGDYSVRFGQGININSGFRTGLSLTTPEFMAGKNEIRQYTSTDENNFFRGAAGSFNLKFIDAFVFYSQNRIDASLNFNEDSVAVSVNNIYKAGLHNTPSEVSKQDVLTEISAGACLSFNMKNLRAGLSWTENRYSLPLFSVGSGMKDIYSFDGTINDLLSADYKWLYKSMLFFGEYSVSKDGGSGFLQGIRLKPDNRLAVNILFRHYDQDYKTIHGNSAGSGSQNRNENGITANFYYEAAKNIFITGGVDLHNSPWLKYRCDAPSQGKKYELKTGYYPTANLSIEVTYNYSDYMLNSTESVQINKPEVIFSRSLKSVIKYAPEANINLATRFEYKVLSPQNKTGLVLSQDLNVTLKRVPVRLWLRWCLFDTDDYDTRIYVYENDMINSFIVPSFFGEGCRSYCMISWKIKKNTELRFKYGISTTNGNSGKTSDREEFKFQLRISV